MKKYIIYSLIALLLLVLIVLKLRSNKKIAQERVYHYDKTQKVTDKKDSLTQEKLNTKNEWVGVFEPYKESKISAEMQGKINHVFVDAGSWVQQGQTLIQLDNTLLQFQLKSVEVQIKGLEADVRRFGVLAKADAIQGVQLEKAILGLEAAKIQRSTILEQISKTSIRAPFSGVVISKLSEEGAFAAPGVPLLQIIDIQSLKFTINVPENDLQQFEIGKSYHIKADAYPEQILSGKLLMVGSKANTGNNFPIQFLVSNVNNQSIKSGMFGKIALKN
ncbi:MAG: efflux RND transporter periplasmic adaptor subunit [Thermonemataceae bacterium]|nr:efflux RND transporter periplasmic adaptor subunit [Thermonemataceae bacterium]